MFLWFLGGSWVVVWAVLQDPAVDYRLVMLGALLPDVIDAPLGGLRVAHTLVGSVAALAIVMAVTVRRRRLRRRLLAVPIGMFVHLVLDGVWTTTRVFWWPFRGWSLAHAGALPSLAHPIALTIGEELAGAVALGWCWVRFGLAARQNRVHFLQTGHLPREAGPPGGTAGLPSPRRRPPGR